MLNEKIKAEIRQYANLRTWFAFKDYIMSRLDMNRSSKAAIIGYGLKLLQQRYPTVFG